LLNHTSICRFICILALVIALFSSAALAQEESEDISLSKHQINMYIAYNKVLVESRMLFSAKQTTNFSIELPYDARDITNKVDNFEYPAILDFNKLLFFLKENKYVMYSYITDELLEGDSFIASLDVPFDTEQMLIELELPEKAVLEKPMRNGAVSGSAVYPRPKALETDGRVIMVVWEFNDLKKGDELAFYVKFKKPFRYFVHTIIAIIGVLVIILAVMYAVFRRKTKKPSPSIVVEQFKEEKDIEKHLKEDEEQIVNILKLKEGQCEQGTLRVATGFSKAKLSGLLKELEERKIIHKEKRGKKNLVFLKD